MNWIDRIPGSFGTDDKEFAGHALDSERASELLVAANKADIGFEKYLAEIEKWLESMNCTAGHIQKQMEKAKDIKSYLKYD